MDMDRIPRPGQIYKHFKDRLYQIITVASHTDTQERMVVYQALYGDYKAYIRPLENFLSEVDHEKYPLVTQKYRFELCADLGAAIGNESEGSEAADSYSKSGEMGRTSERNSISASDSNAGTYTAEPEAGMESADQINVVLLQFLDADSYYKKLEVVTSNRKHLNDRLINDMAVALDCMIEEGPLDQRIQGLLQCLEAMCRFENKRLR
ncbi:hypothetical protein HNQ56_004193 [Anaerotaenia torta]|uniref:DUF1653 domain-containing protein n=1 Tax=Anaerotaenia torta TaxID=433293 RepID=UPI003D200038